VQKAATKPPSFQSVAPIHKRKVLNNLQKEKHFLITSSFCCLYIHVMMIKE